MGDQPFDRAAAEEARLMSLISGTKPKPVVIHTKPVDNTPTSPRNIAPSSGRGPAPQYTYSNPAPQQVPVNASQPAKHEPVDTAPIVQMSSLSVSEHVVRPTGVSLLCVIPALNFPRVPCWSA